MRHTILLLLSAFFLFHPLEGEAGRKEARDKAREKKRVAELVKRLKKGERIPGGADLREAKLSRVNLRGADLFRAKLYGAELYGVELYGADLREAKLSRVNLRGADLSRAYLERAKLSGADLERAVLSKAYLRGATYDDKTVFPAGFDPKSAGMVKAGVKKESADKKLSMAHKPPSPPFLQFRGARGARCLRMKKSSPVPTATFTSGPTPPFWIFSEAMAKSRLFPCFLWGRKMTGAVPSANREAVAWFQAAFL